MSITEVPVDVFPVTPEHARQLVEATLSAVQPSHNAGTAFRKDTRHQTSRRYNVPNHECHGLKTRV